ncbi:MAG: hypothetical protein ABI330_04180 [Caldimonas sp.]
MAPSASTRVARPLALYALGHLTLLCGAWAMNVTGSMLPMALAASVCVMLTVPVIRLVRVRAAARRQQPRSPRL